MKLKVLYTLHLFVVHTVAVMRLHLSEKNNPLLIISFLKPSLRLIFNFLLIIIEMPYCLCGYQLMACWTTCYLWRQVVWKEKRMRCVNILIIKIYCINFSNYERHHTFNQNIQSPLKTFLIFLNLFDSQRVGTPIINERTGVAVICCHGKSN